MALCFATTVHAIILIGSVLCRNYDYPKNQPIIPLTKYDRLIMTNNYETNNSEESFNQNGLYSNFDYNNQKDENDWQNSVPGVPGKDYPNLKTIPETSFDCVNKKPGGYYADMETGCQVFHVCNTRGTKSSFLCSPGSIFNQKYFVCDWWYDVECENASDLYSLNEQLNRAEVGAGPSAPDLGFNDIKYQRYESSRKDYRDNFNSIDLSLAGTGEGASGYATNHRNDSLKSYRSKINSNPEREGENFSRQPIDSGNRRENGFPLAGSNANYLSATGKDWRATSHNDDGKVQSFNGKARPALREEHPTFSDRHQSFGEDRHDPTTNSIFNERRIFDSMPRGFSKNYYNDDVDLINQRHQQEKDKNIVTDNPVVEPRTDFHDVENENILQNGQRDSGVGIVYWESKNEDELDRKRQKEVDDTVLCKNHAEHFVSSGQKNLHETFDAEANHLSYEQPPRVLESFYSKYNNEVGTTFEKNEKLREPPFPPERTYVNQENNKGIVPNFDNVRKTEHPQRFHVRPTGGLRNGLGNGFPSPNRELVGSNAIAGIGEPKLPVGQRPDYAGRYPVFGNQHASQFGQNINDFNYNIQTTDSKEIIETSEKFAQTNSKSLV